METGGARSRVCWPAHADEWAPDGVWSSAPLTVFGGASRRRVPPRHATVRTTSSSSSLFVAMPPPAAPAAPAMASVHDATLARLGPSLTFLRPSTMDLADPRMVAVVSNFFDLEAAIAADPDLSHDKLAVLRKWAEDREDIFPGMTDMQLLLFLQSCYGDTDKTKDCMVNYFRCILEVPQFFDHWDVERDQIKQGLDTVFYSPLPKLSPKNHLMVVCRFRHTDASKYVFSDGSRIFMMTSEAQFLKRGPQEGMCAVMDMTNMCFSHLWRFPVPLVRRFIGMIQEGMPVRLKEIHIVNCSYFLPTLMSFLKPFMKKELADLIQCHSGAMDSFRQQFPAEYLPNELGGTCGTLEEHHNANMELLGKMRPLWEAKDRWSAQRRQRSKESGDS